MCGERIVHRLDNHPVAGSSPRVRGTRLHADAQPAQGRFIPACAGNAQARPRRNRLISLHPRVCGERRTPLPFGRGSRGSSPRVRGTHHMALPRRPTDRFIPACAGNAPGQSSKTSSDPVHPRVCGERICRLTSRSETAGSSPRVRGTPGHQRRHVDDDRFIPACAGNAATRKPRRASCAVHPRVCGERGPNAINNTFAGGSSPRVRGTRCCWAPHGRRRRFIPACAGNALPDCCHSRLCPVHPRVCGERANDRRSDVFAGGSSPRVRGTLERHPAGHEQPRFIPACAGNASPCWYQLAIGAVHPRVCGERCSFHGDTLKIGGSSPRVRGTRPRSDRWRG